MSETAVRSFIGELAVVRSHFRDVEIDLAKCGRLRKLSVSVSPFQVGDAISISFFLDADFLESCQGGSPIGLSLKIEATKESWLLEEYIHFPDGDLDWCDYDGREARFVSVAALIAALPAFSQEALSRYKKVILSA